MNDINIHDIFENYSGVHKIFKRPLLLGSCTFCFMYFSDNSLV